MSKKNQFKITRKIDNELTELSVSRDVYHYINKLEDELAETKRRMIGLKLELEAIKPVLEKEDLKPAVSPYCKDCNFVVKSRYNGDIIGCAKNIVCKDFYPRED